MPSLTDKLRTRAGLLFGRNGFGPRARLATLRPGRASPLHAVLASRRTDEQNREFFAVGGRRYYFEPPYAVRDRSRLHHGTAVVLAEVAADADEMFRPPHVTIKPGDVVLDGGGHVGTSAMTFAARVAPGGGSVHSFEPVMHEAMRRNLEVNDIEGVTVVPMALGRESGDEEITVDDVAIDSSIARARGTGISKGPTIPVKVTTIDDYVRDAGLDRVDLIKLDIEGAEDMAIDGAAETIRRFRPAWTIASYHVDFDGDLQHDKLVRQLKALDYAVEEVRRNGKGVRIFAWGAGEK